MKITKNTVESATGPREWFTGVVYVDPVATPSGPSRLSASSVRRRGPSMSAWTKGELDRIAAADELEIASLRRDGTLRGFVTIWVVRHGDDLYVRSVKGPTGVWFRGTQARHEGRIQAGGVDRDVTYVKADDKLSDEIDRAYRTKYRRYAANIVNSVLTPGARSATLRLVPRESARATSRTPSSSRRP